MFPQLIHHFSKSNRGDVGNESVSWTIPEEKPLQRTSVESHLLSIRISWTTFWLMRYATKALLLVGLALAICEHQAATTTV